MESMAVFDKISGVHTKNPSVQRAKPCQLHSSVHVY